MEPRLGGLSDVDSVTDVFIRAMPDDPQWDYRFPGRHQYPEDHYKFTRMLIERFLDPTYDDWVVVVREVSLEPGNGKKSIVSFAVYRRNPSNESRDPFKWVEEHGGSTRKDANHEHFNAFWERQVQAYNQYFGDMGNDQIHLQILATLPKFRCRGHGSSLCRWGMRVVLKDRLERISVMASPMGSTLYSSLGFNTVDTFSIQVPGEEEKLDLKAMMCLRETCVRLLQQANTADRGVWGVRDG
ncbi:hypothetical protein MFIFM68171_09732 [Madurella fahalii]|uniref:N-acetyltransferase domain-containing protein n=1 Tax=Madurella fahalii TaxID=1157608 RepID=A0ABQ0GP67_9PEZI